MSDFSIKWLSGESRATVTFSQGRYVARVKKLAEMHPDKCEIVAENNDGSICAHIPVAWIRINPTKKLSEEQQEANRKNLLKARTMGRNSTQNGVKTQ